MTVELMHRNQLPKGLGESIKEASGTAFSLNFAVITDPGKAETYSKGEFYWGDAAGTWLRIDPAQHMVFVAMIQQFDGASTAVPDVRSLTQKLIFQAITQAH